MALIFIAQNIILQSKKGLVEVNHLVVETPSYIPDLYIETKKAIPNSHECNGMDPDHLCRDQVFLDSVIDHLRTLGYQGEGFGRSELGAQGHFDVVMEPDDAFDEFVTKLGWEYAGAYESDDGEQAQPNLGVEQAIELVKKDDHILVFGYQGGRYGISAGKLVGESLVVKDISYVDEEVAYADFKALRAGEKTIADLFGLVDRVRLLAVPEESVA